MSKNPTNGKKWQKKTKKRQKMTKKGRNDQKWH